MNRSVTMNAEWLTLKTSLPCAQSDMSRVNSQFVSVQEENHEETTNTIKKSLSQLQQDQISSENTNRGQIDMIEMPTTSVSHYKYLFVYEDRTSRYVVLKALRSIDPKEVAMKLLDVMAIIGVPRVLQSENGRNFTKQVVNQLHSLWDGFSIIPEDVMKLTSERNFKNIIKSWLMKNPNKTWLESIKFIQVFENATFPCKNGKFPYESLFRRNVYEDFFNNSNEPRKDEFAAEEFKFENNYHDECSSVSDGDNSDDDKISEENGATGTFPANLSEENLRTSFNFVTVKNEESPAEDSISEEEVTSVKKSKDKHTFKCKFCPKKYTKLGHLTNHLKSHKNTTECIKCSKKFRTQALYENHMHKSHKELSENLFSKKNIMQVDTKITEITDNSELRLEKETLTTKGNTISEKISKSTKRVSNLQKKSKLREKRPKVNEALLECSYCEQKFDFPSVLKRHIRSHTNERPYVCKICNKSFKQLGHLSQHSITHTDYRSLQCSQCGIKLESLDALKIHSQTHPGESALKNNFNLPTTRLFECDICKKVFTTKSVLERHILTHTHERHFECEVCGKRFKQSGHVKSHMLVHTGERRFQCTICPKRFSLANSLKKHMYIHNGDKPYQCDVCGARFLEKRNLNGHLMTHTNEKPFGCKLCGKRYTLADTLRRHVSAAHEDGRTYQCEICAKMFKQLAHLSVHKKVHNDERPFQCHLCEKNFKHKNVLKSHLAIHANVRPFECDECKATFVRKTNLQTHIASAHMNERPYTCNICGKKFKQVSHLNGHIIVHSNSMPYQCDFCDRRCNRLDNLKKHMRIHTKSTKEFNVLVVRSENVASKIISD